MIEVDQSSVVTGVSGIGGLLIGGRFLLSWWKKQNLHDAVISGTDAHIDRLEADAQRWKEMYDETHKLLEEQRETNALLRSQNAMMRMLLIQKGITPAELTAIGANA